MSRSTSSPPPAPQAPRRGPLAGRTWVAALASGGLVGTALAAPAPALAAVVPAPVVHYAFDDEVISGVVTDSSGAGRNATLVNPTTAASVASVDGRALDLPGGAASSTGAYVRLPVSVLQGASDLTVSVRARWDGTGGPWQRLFDLGQDTTRYLFSSPSNGQALRTAATVAGGGGEAQITGSAPLPADSWRTVTVTLDTTRDRLTTYLDGVEVGSVTSTIAASQLLRAGASSAGYIGRSVYPDPLLDGAVDDFQVFHTALDAAQVAELVPGDEPTVVQLSRTAFELRSSVGAAPALPAGVRASFSDGYDRTVPIVWDAVDPQRYAQRGTFSVTGRAGGTTVTATVTVIREGETTIDLGSNTGDFSGGAAGTLYGLYDDGMPTDNLVEGFGLQTNATKGQDGAQHPGSDALEVLEPLGRTTDGDVYIRPTDYYRGFPYQWPGTTPREKLEHYFGVLDTQVDQVAALLEEQPELTDNIVIEPFNEPEGNMFGTGQWSYDRVSWLTDPTDYFAAWDRSYRLIQQALPDVRIAGPNTSVLFPQVQGFLQHAVEAGTLPDIITWHELSDPATIRESVATYRAWEQELFAGTARAGTQLPINIDEYAFNYHTSVPGQMIQWISAVEDSKVQAMIAFWNLNGNLSDSAVQTNRGNGQWWLYNAYTRMTGHTVAVSPPQPGESYTLQGVATLDEDRKLAQAILGGKDGKAYVELTNVPAAVFGDEVRVTVKEIPWTGQLGDSPAPRHVAEYTARVTDGKVAVDFGAADLPALEESSAYQILVTPAGAGTSTSARPLTWEQSYEAEDARYTGAGFGRNGPEGSPDNVSGFYTSGGFDVGGLRTGADGALEFTVDVPEDGDYDLQTFSSSLNTYAAVQEQGPTNVFVRVDGAAEQELFLPLSYKWVVWDHADTTVRLTKGQHTITLAARSLDGTRTTKGDAILDRIVLSKRNPQAAASVYEAEYAELQSAEARYAAPRDGAEISGPGGVELSGDDEATFWVYAAEDGEHTLTVDTAAGRAALEVNGQAVRVARNGTAVVSLEGGINKVVVSSAEGSTWLDRMVVQRSTGTLVPTGYEAEDATLAGAAKVVDLSLASGGQAVDAIGGAPGNGNTLSFDVQAGQEGLHAVTVRFSNPEQVPATHYNPNPVARHADISVNGQLVAEQVMFVPTFHRNNFWERTVLLPLEAGANTISFAAQEEPNWDGTTYASDVWGPDWPGLILRASQAPIIDRIEVAPFTLVSIDALIDIVHRYNEDGTISDRTTANLLYSLERASAGAAAGSEKQAIQYLRQFIARARSQVKGDDRDLAARSVLVQEAETLLANYQALEDAENADRWGRVAPSTRRSRT